MLKIQIVDLGKIEDANKAVGIVRNMLRSHVRFEAGSIRYHLISDTSLSDIKKELFKEGEANTIEMYRKLGVDIL